MVREGLNWVTSPAAWCVEPLVSSPFSRSRTSFHPARAGCFVVRCWADDTGLLAIDRDNEYENSVRAAEVGVGAPVIAYLPEHNTMVVGFIEGTTMNAATLRAGDHPAAIAAACRRLHGAR